MAESLRDSAEILQNGLSVCIFPEGARTHTGEILAPRPGAGILSCHLNVPIVPVLIDGAVETMSKMKPGFRPCEVRIRVGDPIQPPSKESYTSEDYQTVMEKWYSTLRDIEKHTSESA